MTPDRLSACLAGWSTTLVFGAIGAAIWRDWASAGTPIRRLDRCRAASVIARWRQSSHCKRPRIAEGIEFGRAPRLLRFTAPVLPRGQGRSPAIGRSRTSIPSASECLARPTCFNGAFRRNRWQNASYGRGKLSVSPTAPNDRAGPPGAPALAEIKSARAQRPQSVTTGASAFDEAGNNQGTVVEIVPLRKIVSLALARQEHLRTRGTRSRIRRAA